MLAVLATRLLFRFRVTTNFPRWGSRLKLRRASCQRSARMRQTYGSHERAERDLFCLGWSNHVQRITGRGAGGAERNEREQFQSGGGKQRCRVTFEDKRCGKENSGAEWCWSWKDRAERRRPGEAASAAHAPIAAGAGTGERSGAGAGYLRPVTSRSTLAGLVRDLQEREGAGKSAEELVKMALKKFASGG